MLAKKTGAASFRLSKTETPQCTKAYIERLTEWQKRNVNHNTANRAKCGNFRKGLKQLFFQEVIEMGHRNRDTGGSLHQQVYNRLQSMCGYGRSKQNDKALGLTSQYIYSFSSMQTYMRHCNYFVTWCKNSQNIQGILGHKPRTLDECLPFVEMYIRARETQGVSAYTIKMEKSALSKLYQQKFNIKTIETRRRNITRSRGDKEQDKHFSEDNNRSMVTACRCIGFRRSELERAKPTDLFCLDGTWFMNITGKGGKVRAAQLIGTPEEISVTVGYINTLTGNNHVHSNADIHSYRAEYATRAYKLTAKEISALEGLKINYTAITGKKNKDGTDIYKNAIYYCRGDQKGLRLDRAAMVFASQYLGHNRESVVGEHYIRL